MTAEVRLFVRMPEVAVPAVLELQRRSLSALDRAAKAPVGDRIDIARFERAQTEIELLAMVAANAEAPAIEDSSPVALRSGTAVVGSNVPEDVSDATVRQLRAWEAEGAVVVACTVPLRVGETVRPLGTGEVRPVAEVWESPTGSRGKQAVRERFLAQLEAAVANPLAPEVLCPSGVSNTVLTDGLRSFACRIEGVAPVMVPVAYRDGSRARPFSLRALDLIDDREHVGTIYAFSLLSIRHVALDALVHGAWVRNTDVSRPRPAGDTDELVYRESVDQLERLCAAGPTTVLMYQTGLDTAILGFYRAVAEQLAARSSDLVVVPRYFQRDGDYVEGEPWRVR